VAATSELETPSSCVPYYTECTGNACAACCADDHCIAGSFHESGQRVGDLPNGESCDRGGKWASNFCEDGVCCNSACNAERQACILSGTVGTLLLLVRVVRM
jgi:hypothetical protein